MGLKPGPPPANEPAAFEFLTDNRLVQNSNLTRMPTTQRGWNTFIQELNKWIKNETGNFDVGGSATAQFTGFSTDPSTANIWWHRYGQMVHMQFEFTFGTSDASSFTITGLPENITPRDTMLCLVGGMRDNSAALTTVSTVEVSSTGGLGFRPTIDITSTWTASGTKGFDGGGSPLPSIIYSLRQPGKH